MKRSLPREVFSSGGIPLSSYVTFGIAKSNTLESIESSQQALARHAASVHAQLVTIISRRLHLRIGIGRIAPSRAHMHMISPSVLYSPIKN
jgi:hypothetical protein